MKKIVLILLVLVSFISKGQSVAELSETFLKKMIREQFDSCQTYFDTSVSNQLDAGMMRDMWNRIPQYVGEYKSYEDIRTEKIDTLDAVLIRCIFEKTKLDLKLVYNEQKKIVGIFFLPPKSKTAYNPPDYFEASKQYETKLTVKTGTYELPGTLCVPNNVSDPPVVILIAGSGPNDKDETIGPNKPLKDIAIGIAAKGIASFRYDKRTYKYKDMKPEAFGINEEVIDDALSAIKLLRGNALTKSSKIFIAGHSLGAMCAPLIASKSKDVSGVILMAGPARAMEDLIVEQYEYLSAIDTSNKAIKAELPSLRQKAAIIKDPKALKKAESKDLPLGIPAYYWQSLQKYDLLKISKKIKQPILVLQGERDYQVLMKDFEIWKKELSADPKNKFISYPYLNHLLMKGDGKSEPAEYTEPGNVDHKLILDIVDFIKTVK
jgi:dienelactone hydrolase